MKLNKILWILPLMFVLMLSLVSASVPFIQDQPVSLTTSSSTTGLQGMVFEVDENIVLVDAIVTSGVTATTAYLHLGTSTTGTLLKSVSIVGGNATFDYLLQSGTSYHLSVDSGGSSFVRYFESVGGYPSDQGTLTWTGGNSDYDGAWYIWDYVYLDLNETSESPSFDVTAVDFWDDTSILTFNATIDGTLYQTTNGTIHTDLFQNDTSTYDLVVVGDGYFSETYSAVDVSSNYEAVLHQSEISFDSFEFITNSTLSNVTYTIDGQENTTFYLSEGSYIVLVEPDGYYPQNYSFNVTALDNLTIDIDDFYNSVLTLNLNDVITTDLIEYTSYVVVNNDDGFNQSYSNSNGTLNIDLIQDNYSLTLWADNYAFKYVNVTLDNLTESFDYSLYSNNSLWVTALDQNTGSTLLNFSVEVFDANNSYAVDSNNTGIVRLNNITSGIYTLRVDTEGYSVAEYALTMTGGSHQAIIAYLVASGSDTIFTIVDSISSGIIEGASINMYKTIGSVWTLVSSQESDITGRVQFTYIPNVEYRFIIDADGYELRTFFLKPLFTTYTIRLTPDVVSVPDLNTGSYIYSINNSGLFYDDQNNSFEVSITSGTGTIEYYNLTATNFDGSIYSESCIVASGCSDPFIFEITGANFADVVSVEYWIKESGRSEKYFKKVYHVQDIYDPSTLEGWKDVDDYAVDSLTKAFIAMIICLIMVGFVSVGSIMVGVPPVTASGVVLAVLVEVFAYVGFIPSLAGHLVALGCLMILIFGRGEI